MYIYSSYWFFFCIFVDMWRPLKITKTLWNPPSVESDVWRMKTAIWVWIMFRCLFFWMIYPAASCERQWLTHILEKRSETSWGLISLRSMFKPGTEQPEMFVFWRVQFRFRRYSCWQSESLWSKKQKGKEKYPYFMVHLWKRILILLRQALIYCTMEYEN